MLIKKLVWLSSNITTCVNKQFKINPPLVAQFFVKLIVIWGIIVPQYYLLFYHHSDFIIFLNKYMFFQTSPTIYIINNFTIKNDHINYLLIKI